MKSFGFVLAAAMSAQVTIPKKETPAPPSIAAALKAAPEARFEQAAPKAPAPEAVGTPLRTGEHRIVPGAWLKKGTWTALKDGRRVWRLAIKSPGAKSMRVHFTGFKAANGMVWVHDGKKAGGPYAGNGIHGDGEFWSDIVEGDRVTVEYLPENPSAKLIPFSIREIAHQWR